MQEQNKIQETKAGECKDQLNFSGSENPKVILGLRTSKKEIRETMVLDCDVRVGVYREKRVNFF